MNYSIRDATPGDLDAVLALNESEVPHVGSIALADMQALMEMSAYFRVAYAAQNKLLAFLLGLAPGAGYSSLNYRWFDTRYEKFAYIDRIAVAPQARRLGIAQALYGDFERQTAGWARRLCCEVNLVPENPVSLAFHQRLGFARVGTLETHNGSKKVALLTKEIG